MSDPVERGNDAGLSSCLSLVYGDICTAKRLLPKKFKTPYGDNATRVEGVKALLDRGLDTLASVQRILNTNVDFDDEEEN